MKEVKEEISFEHSILLKKFILEFLPLDTAVMKSNDNEVGFVTDTVVRIFNKHLNISLENSKLYLYFGQLNYVFNVKERFRNETKQRFENRLKLLRFLGLDKDLAFFYFDVNGNTVTNLRKTTRSLKLQRDIIKIANLERLNKRVEEFFEKENKTYQNRYSKSF